MSPAVISVLKLAVVFATIIAVLRFKKPLWIAILAGTAMTILLYQISPVVAANLAFKAVFSQSTLILVASMYLITFIQRMLEHRKDLERAERAMARLFNNRRINTMVIPTIIGMLPSPAAIFIAGAMVEKSTGKDLSAQDKTFVASYFRHIPEAFLPTYASILLACQLAGVNPGSFVLYMLPVVALLLFLGYFFYLRKVPKETGEPASQNKGYELKEILVSLWPILFVIFAIVALRMSVYLAVGIAIVGYFITGKFTFDIVKPFIRSAFEPKIMINIIGVMVFKEMLIHSKVVEQLPRLFAGVPIPPFIIFGLMFILGSMVAGGMAMITLVLPMAFATIPGAGIPLLVFLMSCNYMAMQFSPTHICLFLACEYFKTEFDQLVKRTLPVAGVFFVFVTIYYLLLSGFGG